MLKNLKLYIAFGIISAFPAYSQFAGAGDSPPLDTLSLPVIQIKPDYIEVERPDNGKFVEYTVKVLNRGVQTLRLLSVQPSCYCASGKILNGAIDPMGLGKIQFSINLDGMAPGTDTIEFIVKSNAKNSSVKARMKVLDKKSSDSPSK